MEINDTKRTCKKCFVEKSLIDFPKNGIYFKHQCKKCNYKYGNEWTKNKWKISAIFHKQLLEWAKKSRIKNKEKIRAYDKLRRRTIKYKICHKKSHRKWGQTPQGKKILAKCFKEWCCRPKSKMLRKLTRAKRRALENASAIIPISATFIQRLYTSEKCYWCECPLFDKKIHLDHVIPLSRGGKHSEENLVAACSICNLRKSCKLPEVFKKELTAAEDACANGAVRNRSKGG